MTTERIIHRRNRASPVLDEFAELLAEGVAPNDAAARMGKPREHGQALLQRIRIKLGPQAR